MDSLASEQQLLLVFGAKRNEAARERQRFESVIHLCEEDKERVSAISRFVGPNHPVQQKIRERQGELEGGIAMAEEHISFLVEVESRIIPTTLTMQGLVDSEDELATIVDSAQAVADMLEDMYETWM